MRYWLNEGGMHHETVDPNDANYKKMLPDRYPKNSIIEKPDDVNMDELFPGKWKEVRDPKGTPILPPVPAQQIQAMIPGGMVGQRTPVPAKTPPETVQDAKTADPPVVVPEAPPATVKKGKGKTKKGKAAPAKEADSAALASVEPEDITDDYKIAGKNGLKVFMLPGGAGYNITEEESPETPINKKPLKLDGIEKCIEGYIEDDE